MNIDPQIQSVIAQIPAWQNAQTILVDLQKGGLTNANYVLTVDGERFVLRLSGENTAQLGIDRQAEHDAIMAASKAGIAPEVILFTLPEGHLVTRFIEGGREWTIDEFKAPAVIRRVAKTMKQVHGLPPIGGQFSPYRDVERRLEAARMRGIALPRQIDRLLTKMDQIERQRAAAPLTALCHNDPFHNNFIDDGCVRLLDWEFAGMGDVFYDLASVCHFFAAEQRAYLLECYFGEVTDSAAHILDEMWFIVAFWNAAWALLQVGHPHADFDYAGMAERVFARMEARL
ncbi:MAG: phosphotransferase family protein [Anaerolineae bacterium]|nr:phosphotransferase family protein [Anaerolineae bacterium]